jgi:hypothetical protein
MSATHSPSAGKENSKAITTAGDKKDDAVGQSPTKRIKYVFDLEYSSYAPLVKPRAVHGTPSKIVHLADNGPVQESFYNCEGDVLDSLVVDRVNVTTKKMSDIIKEMGKQVKETETRYERDIADLKNR